MSTWESYRLTPEQFQRLANRFLERYSDFTDFQNPGQRYLEEERDYKCDILAGFKDLGGSDYLRSMLQEGKAKEAADKIGKILRSNIVHYIAWDDLFGATDEKAEPILRAFLEVTEGPYQGPETTETLFAAIAGAGCKAGWDAISVTLWALRPDDYAPIKISHYRRLAEEVGCPLPKRTIDANKLHEVLKLFEAFREALEPWKPRDLIDVQSFVWVVRPGPRKNETAPDQPAATQLPSQEPRWWLVGTGHSGEYWEEFLREGIVAVGFEELGDIRELGSKKDIQEILKQADGNSGSCSNDALAAYEFANVISIGDFVVAKQGTKTIHGVGIVRSGYRRDPQRAAYKHVRQVDWQSQGPWDPGPEHNLAVKTLTDITSNEALREQIKRLTEAQPLQYWWLNNNPDIWDLNALPVGGREAYTALNEKGNKRKVYKYFEQVAEGDAVLGYVTAPTKEITAVGRISRGLHEGPDGPQIEFEKLEQLTRPVPMEELLINPALQNAEPIQKKLGTLFRLTKLEYEAIRVIIDKPAPPNPEYSLAQCAAETCFEESLLGRWVRAIERKKQAVLYGPPGTGKTYVANRLARHLIGGSDGFADLVQFHPAYGYEDFIQGIRPQVGESGNLEYEMITGRFLDFCRKASLRSGTCVLIIDEINRANLARVLGELMYLLEYREEEVPLAGGGRFRIPTNVRILGTMNTADRSIALVDHALRRRFAFVKVLPNMEILRRFHEDEDGVSVDGLIGVLGRVNAQIGDYHYSVGISFFLRRRLKDQIEDIWTMEIEPYLEEFFFDQPDVVDDFRWEKVSSEILG